MSDGAPQKNLPPKQTLWGAPNSPVVPTKKPPNLGAPLRNRIVDLLLTMDRWRIQLPQAGRRTGPDTSRDQRRQAPDAPSRAPFATQSATHSDLAPTDCRHRDDPAKIGSIGGQLSPAGHGQLLSLGGSASSRLRRPGTEASPASTASEPRGNSVSALPIFTLLRPEAANPGVSWPLRARTALAPARLWLVRACSELQRRAGPGGGRGRRGSGRRARG
jgi:hypothetical protein